MKIIALIFFISTLAACDSGGGDGGNTTTEGLNTYTPHLDNSVIVYGDSLCAPVNGWVDQYVAMSGNLADRDCTGGIKLSEHRYSRSERMQAVLALGINDLYQGSSLIDTLNMYEDTMLMLEARGHEVICWNYPNQGYLARELNAGINLLCEGKRIIKASSDIVDYIHLSPSGATETAVNAWRTL